MRNADFLDSSYKIPGGGWLSSAEDMARFEVATVDDKLIRRTTRNLMWTPLKPTDGSKDDYALGWGSGIENGTKGVGHPAGQQGTGTAFLIAPEQRAGVVVLTNMEGCLPTTLLGRSSPLLSVRRGTNRGPETSQFSASDAP